MKSKKLTALLLITCTMMYSQNKALKSNTLNQSTTMSQSAYNSLNPNQKKDLEKYSELVSLSINTIETIGGGSVRCMIAEIFSQTIK